jgi:hypothetical protein
VDKSLGLPHRNDSNAPLEQLGHHRLFPNRRVLFERMMDGLNCYDPKQHAGYVDHWIQILTETPKEILYAAADAERISEYILTIEQRRENNQRREATNVKRDIPQAERTYLAVPYNEREEAKALGARWGWGEKSVVCGAGS